MSDGTDPLLRDAFFEEVVAMAERVGGKDCSPYIANVRHRLIIGAARYGPESWRTKDNIPELLQETPDVGCYAYFEHQKDLEDARDVDTDRAHHLFMCAVYAALADWHARAAYRG